MNDGATSTSAPPKEPSSGASLKVVLYSAPFFPSIGGMEEFSRNLAFGLRDLGCTVEVVTDTASAHEGADSQFPFAVHRTTALPEKARLFGAADVVIFAGVRLRETVMSIPLRKRLILTHHGTYMAKDQPRTLIMGLAKRLVSRLFANVSVSQFVAAKIGGRQKVIHGCFDDRVFMGDSNGARSPGSFVFYGRLVSDKGCPLVIKAFAEVLRSNKGAKLTVIGGGPEKEALIQLADDIGVADAVTFTGVVPIQELASRLAASRCVVVPSTWEEPFGLVVLEALASGCEVIASNRGGLPEALGGWGWTVDPTVEGLTAAMLRVAQGESRRGASVADWLRSHTRAAISRQYMDEIRARLG